ncbi:MAG: Gfo/Idh/MocA family oxidoreductase, partial [Pseudomonadota bacterium]|nr:Gfo/Idh/MocA family oxidoreductase [Pseudomonadota bacterium]
MRALIIGTGSIGQRHMRNLRSVDPAIEFTLLRRNAEPLALWPDATVEVDLAAALRLTPDLAVLATPSALHFDVLQSLIAHRIPAYVEKPIVTTADQVAVIREALAQNPGVAHIAGFNLRLLPSLEDARQAVSRGDLGQIVRASFSAGQWLPDWRKGQDHRQGYSARSSEGGGVLFDLSHEFDAARFLLGDMELLYAATARVDALEIDSEAVAVATARSTSGALVSINLDYVTRHPVRRYELVGTQATLTWDLPAKSLVSSSSTGSASLSEDPSDFDVAMTYQTAMQAFLAGVRTGDAGDLQDLEDGLR